MSQIAVYPLQWSKLENIDDVPPIGESDADCRRRSVESLRSTGA
jgi:hypothetical protein